MARNYHWGISVDGAEKSKEAFLIVKNSLMTNGEHISVMHLANDTLDYRPQLKSQYIRQDYENQLLPYLPPSAYSIHVNQRNPSMSTAEQIRTGAVTWGFNFLVIGFSGRKGLGADHTVLKSAVTNSIANLPTNLLVIKRMIKRPPGFNWLVLVDPSDTSKTCFNIAASLMAHGDTFTVLHARKQNLEDTQGGYYREQMASRGIEGHFIDIPYSTPKPGTEISAWVNDNNVDYSFLVIGNTGKGAVKKQFKHRTGSNTETILKFVKTNILVIK